MAMAAPMATVAMPVAVMAVLVMCRRVGGGGGGAGGGGEQGATPAQTHEATLRGGGEEPHNISGSRPTSKPYST
jgi:hypothetical protein